MKLLIPLLALSSLIVGFFKTETAPSKKTHSLGEYIAIIDNLNRLYEIRDDLDHDLSAFYEDYMTLSYGLQTGEVTRQTLGLTAPAHYQKGYGDMDFGKYLLMLHVIEANRKIAWLQKEALAGKKHTKYEISNARTMVNCILEVKEAAEAAGGACGTIDVRGIDLVPLLHQLEYPKKLQKEATTPATYPGPGVFFILLLNPLFYHFLLHQKLDRVLLQKSFRCYATIV